MVNNNIKTDSNSLDGSSLGSNLVMMIDAKPYKVNIHFNDAATENMGDKIMRLIRNEVETAPISTSIIMDTKAVVTS